MEEPRNGDDKIFENFSRSLTPFIFETDLEGTISSMDRAGFEISGYTQEDIQKGLNVDQLVVPEDRGRIKKNAQRTLGGEKPEANECAWLRKDGRICRAMMYFTPISHESRPVGLRWFAIDITEPVKLEQTLSESEEKYRVLVENSPTLIAILQDGALKYANKSMCQKLGWTFDEMTSPAFKPLEMLVPERLHSFVLDRMGKTLRGDAMFPQPEGVLKTRSGAEVHTRSYSQRILYHGRPAIEIILVDITDQKKTEEKIKFMEEYNRNIIESNPSPILVVRGKSVEHVNASFVSVFGRTREEYISKNLDEIMPPGTASVLEGPHYLGELREIEVEGRVYNIHSFALGETATEKGRRVLVLQDITERRRIEVEKLRILKTVARSVAHDLRNPLAAVRNAVFLLRDNVKSDQEQEMLDLMERNVLLANDSLTQLIDFQSELELLLQETELKALIQDVLHDIVEPKGVKVTASYGDITAKVDGKKLRRVITHIILNAIQAMPRGGEVTISTSKANGFAEITIKDTGVGISKGEIGEIFKPFYTTKAKGLGLGLKNAKMLVEAHGGGITLTSEEGKGTTVTIRLPLNQSGSKL